MGKKITELTDGGFIKDGDLLAAVRSGSTVKVSSIQNVYHAKAYNLKCDGKVLTDVTATNGSPVISSASYDFISTDVGKTVSIHAGSSVNITGNTSLGSTLITNASTLTGLKISQVVVGSGIPAGTRIDSFPTTTTIKLTNAATATASSVSLTSINVLCTTIQSVNAGDASLAANASTSVSSTLCTFGTDDASAMNALWTSISAAGGGIIQLPQQAICVVGNTTNIKSLVGIRGTNRFSSILKWISTSDMTDSMFRGSSGGPFYANSFRDIGMDLLDATQASYHVEGKAIYAIGLVDVEVLRTYIVGSPATGIGIDGLIRAKINFNWCDNCGRLNGGGAAGGAGIGLGIGNTGFGESYQVMGNFCRVVNGTYGIFTETQTAYTEVGPKALIDSNIIEIAGTTTKAGIADVGMSGTMISNSKIYASPDVSCTGISQSGIALDHGTLNKPPSVRVKINNADIRGVNKGVFVNYDTTAPTESPALLNIENVRIADTVDVGMKIVTSSSYVLDGLKTSSVLIDKPGGHGVHLAGSGGMKNIDLSGVTVRDCATGKVPIYIESPIDGLKMHASNLLDTRDPVVHVNCMQIYGRAVTNADIQGTTMRSFTGSGPVALLNSATLSGIMKDCEGYDLTPNQPITL